MTGLVYKVQKIKFHIIQKMKYKLSNNRNENPAYFLHISTKIKFVLICSVSLRTLVNNLRYV